MFIVINTYDVRDSVKFYVEHFGFEIVADLDWYVHLRASGQEIAFMKPYHDSQPNRVQHPFSGDGLIISFELVDLQDVYSKLKTNSNIVFVQDMKTEEWGQTHFMIECPSGAVIDLIQAES